MELVVEEAINDIFSSLMGKVSKPNIEALGKVNFSTKIDFFAAIRNPPAAKKSILAENLRLFLV